METAVLFINGTVGVGKSTVAEALGQTLEKEHVAHAIIDLDHVRRAWPAPPEDPFNHELELTNLTCLVSNYATAGIKIFILAGVIEDEREIPRYKEAVGGRPLMIVRVTANESTRTTRIRTRHARDPNPDALDWHLERTVELEKILVHRRLEDVVIDSSDKAPAVVAEEIWQITDARLRLAK